MTRGISRIRDNKPRVQVQEKRIEPHRLSTSWEWPYRCEDASLEERDTLRFDTKNYRLSAETRALLEAILRADPHRFLTFDELFGELARFFLARQPTLRGQVERYLRSRGSQDPEDPREKEEPEREEDAREEPREV